MAQYWRELSRLHQRLIQLGGVCGFFYILFTTFRAGVLFPVKQDQRMTDIESGQASLSNKVEEISYKQDQQHDLLIRIEERLWPNSPNARRRVVGVNEPKNGNIQ